MFNKMKFGQSPQVTPVEQTVIGQSAVVVGNIDVNGSPNAQLSVLSKAHVEGDISAQQAVVNGVVTGNIESSGRVELHAGAQVKGNISYSTMAIEHGAQLFGMMTNTSDVKP